MPSKDHFMSKLCPFETLQMAKIPYKVAKMRSTFCDHPVGASSDIWDQIWPIWTIWWSFSGVKRLDLWLLEAKKGISLLMQLPFWGLQKGHVIQKWVSDAYPVIPGEYVVFGTEPGAIKTCRGAKVPFTGYYSLCHDFPYIVEAHVHYGIIALWKWCNKGVYKTDSGRFILVLRYLLWVWYGFLLW